MATQAEVKWALKRPRVFPGYSQIIVAAVSAFIGYGAYMYSWGVISSQLIRERRVMRTDLALGNSLGRMEGGLEAVPKGYLIDTWGPRNVSALGFIIGGVGYILLGMWLVNAAWWMWLTYVGMITLVMNAALYSCSGKILGWYFIKTRGRWIALSTVGAAFGGMIMSPIAAAVITAYSWNIAAYATGALMIFIGAPMAFIGYKNKGPQAYGLLPDNEKLPHERTKEELEAAKARGSAKVMTADDFLPDLTVWDALRTRAFWGLALAAGFGGFYSFTFPTFLTDHIRNQGFTLQESANYFALYFPMTVVGRFIVAGLADRINPQHFSAGAYLGMGVGVLAVAFATKERAWLLWAYAPIYGIPMGMSPAVGQHLTVTWFGRKWQQTIPGFRALFDTPFVFGGSLLFGIMADQAGGSYVGSFTYLGICLIIAAFCNWGVARMPKPMKEARRKALEHGIRMVG